MVIAALSQTARVMSAREKPTKSPPEVQTEILAIRLKPSVHLDLAELADYVGANNPTELVRGWVLERILEVHGSAAFRAWKVAREQQQERTREAKAQERIA
jgi:hypothetical protein